MAIYSLAQLTAGSGAAKTAIWELRPTNRIAVLEIGFIRTRTGARELGLGYPTAIGIGPTNVAFIAEDFASPASATNATTVWSGAQPPAPANFLRRATHQAQNMIVWRFPEGLYVAGGGSLALFQIIVGNAVAIHCVIDE
jgi:hypothetical protein